jgi:hypothetical protein
MLRLGHLPGTQAEAQLVWGQFKSPLLKSLHLLVSFVFLTLYLRGEPQRALLATIFVCNATSWLCCQLTSRRDPDQADAFTSRVRMLAHGCGLLSWCAHTMVGAAWLMHSSQVLHEAKVMEEMISQSDSVPRPASFASVAAGPLQVMARKTAGESCIELSCLLLVSALGPVMSTT